MITLEARTKPRKYRLDKQFRYLESGLSHSIIQWQDRTLPPLDRIMKANSIIPLQRSGMSARQQQVYQAKEPDTSFADLDLEFSTNVKTEEEGPIITSPSSAVMDLTMSQDSGKRSTEGTQEGSEKKVKLSPNLSKEKMEIIHKKVQDLVDSCSWGVGDAYLMELMRLMRYDMGRDSSRSFELRVQNALDHPRS
ncbi:MAG: hypothetical protein M1816_001608 [Peltula sp. TS41687]|nr:MAG: hypothetical protein M1816_001608 [Peltula sp. TS41687]